MKGPLKRKGSGPTESADVQVYLLDHCLLFVKPKFVNNLERYKIYKKVHVNPILVSVIVNHLLHIISLFHWLYYPSHYQINQDVEALFYPMDDPVFPTTPFLLSTTLMLLQLQLLLHPPILATPAAKDTLLHSIILVAVVPIQSLCMLPLFWVDANG